MSVVNPIRIKNIVSFTHGTTQFIGINQLSYQVNKGNIQPVLNEGDQYPTGAENMGSEQFPVTGSVVLESAAVVSQLLALSPGSLVVIGKAEGSANNQIFTFSNCQFTQGSQSLDKQRRSNLTVQFSCHSSDGAALPLAITSV